MAIGDTVQAGLMRVDFSPIARAGEAQARGNQAFGLGFERMVDRFNQRVKEKQAKEERDRAYRLQKMIADRNFEMQVGQLGLQQAAAEQSMAAKAKADQLADKAMQDKVALSNFLMSGTEMDPEVVEDFNQAQPGLFALGGDEGARNRFLEYKRDTAPKTGPLGGELDSSEFASKAMEAGVDPVLAGNYFMKLQAREDESLQNAPKPMTPEQFLDYQIKLNKERRDQAKEEREASEFEEENKPMPPADPVYQQSALDAIDDAISYVKKDSIINPTVGFLSDTAKGIGGTDAANLDAALSTITSSVGFDRLQAMRDASPTGGALGQVSENELRQLNASLGSISQLQDDEQLLKNLEKIKARYSSAVKAIEAQRRAYKMGKSFKTKEEALEFMESQSPDTGGIKTSTQGNYKIGDLSVGGYQPGQ
jgi:hypothetical protein